MASPSIRPHMLVADEQGNIYDHPDFLLLCRRGEEWSLPRPDELMPLPEESELFLLPGRRAVGLNPETGETEVMEDWAVAAFAAPGLARLVPGQTELPVLLAGLGLGGMAHVLLDMCTPSGVPLMPFSRTPRFSLNLCRTGSLGEYVFLAVALGVMWLVKGDELRPLLNSALRGLRHLAG